MRLIVLLCCLCISEATFKADGSGVGGRPTAAEVSAQGTSGVEADEGVRGQASFSEQEAREFKTTAAPSPAFAYRVELPTGFRKPAPTSIADLKAMEQHDKALVRRV